MKKNINRAEKYFKQKSFSNIEIVLLVISIIAAYVMFFVRFGGPIALPVLLICTIGFGICRSKRVKDDELEEIIHKIIKDNQIEVSDNTIKSYDLRNTYVRRMKNGSWVSPKYYLTEITVFPSEVQLKSYAVNIVDSSVKTVSHCLTSSESMEISEEMVRTQYGNKRVDYIKIANCDFEIPIPQDDYRTSQLIEQITNKS